MSGLEPLIAKIYHETQTADSMLCAQHALNSLLQQPYFTAPDLSDIAKRLDELEESYDDANNGATSMNMDDTGFFSVQVLDTALEVFGLNLTRWRSEEMRPYHNKPHTQLAFILNLQQHWFSLRRFGPADPVVDNDEGLGHWFNLNSFLPTPEWVGKLYLGMVLQQAEADGYSVFAVTQADSAKPLALSRTEADDIAATLPEPTGAIRPTPGRTTTSHVSKPPPPRLEGLDFEDEDYELQAALQASLMSGGGDAVPSPLLVPPPVVRQPVPLPTVATPGPAITLPVTPNVEGPLSPIGLEASGFGEHLDPLASSAARSRALLQAMQQEQAAAHREIWETVGPSVESRDQGREEEEEMIRQAIAESEAMARAEGHGRDEDDDAKMEVDRPSEIPAASQNPYPSFSGSDHRVYDDDDAELQAALKASLEEVPEGWLHPDLDAVHPKPPTTATNVTPPASRTPAPEQKDPETASILSEESDVVPSSDPTAVSAEEVSVDEMRRRRLARFGG